MEFKSKLPKPNASVPHYKAMETLDPKGGTTLGPGIYQHNEGKEGTTRHYNILKIKVVGLMVSEKIF